MTTNSYIDKIPKAAHTIIRLLTDAGFESYFVGGAVRDILSGATPKDFDLASLATPKQVAELFEANGIKVVPTGLKHGTVIVVLDGTGFEVTTFRTDGDYIDGRHPTEIKHARSIEEDLARRDFTINAMALSSKGELIDLYGGRSDLERKILCTVGDPWKRFSEDALRILRALRFASRLDYSIEQNTRSAIFELKDKILLLSKERIGNEFAGIVSGHYAAKIIREYMDVFIIFIPEFEPMVGFDQHNVHHAYDVMEHSLVALSSQTSDDLSVRFATLFHDIGKPEKFFIDERGGHFYGHDESSARITREILRRLRYSKAFIDEVTLLIKSHMIQLNPTNKSIRRQISKLGEHEFFKLLDLKRSDIKGLMEQDRLVVANIDEIEHIARDLEAHEERFTKKSLEIDGHDIMALGVGQGKKIGEVLEYLFEGVLEGDLTNNRDVLYSAARQYLNI